MWSGTQAALAAESEARASMRAGADARAATPAGAEARLADAAAPLWDARPYRLVLFPGMGADARVFEAQRTAFPHLEVPAWLPPLPREPLADYGRRMAVTIDTRTPFFLGGVSMGGMLALEVARHVRPRAVFLVGSCRSADQIARFLRWCEALARVLPNRLVAAGKTLAPFAARGFGQLTIEQKRLHMAMLRDTPVELIRWCAQAATHWTGCNGLPCAVFQIHGDRDRLMPLKNIRPDRVVRGGGHLLNVTHAEEANAFMAECMTRVGGGDT